MKKLRAFLFLCEEVSFMAQEEKDEKLMKIRHSMAHVMAEAVLEMFPDGKIAIGPSIENGFYYDFGLPRALVPADLEEITERMRKIIGRASPFERKVVSRDEAKKMFAAQPFKLETIDELPEGEEITVYSQGKFTDLCRGPHVEATNKLDPTGFKLLSIAGAYWRGDEKRPMLQRIYGTAWANKKDLQAHLDFIAEMEKRDHRRLGKELDLFSLHEQAGPGLVYWHPKGARVRLEIENFWRKEHLANGYDFLFTPHLGRSWLWETSGHLGFYKENMYPPMEMDNTDYYSKPMNCPFHIMIYQTRKHSYRELPLRWAELGTVYRYEKSGVLHGLFRVRGFTQDDAHIYCTPEQIESEIREVLRFCLYMWKAFGFDKIKAYLSTKPKDSVGDVDKWDQATVSLKKAIESEGLEYQVDEGGGAFYGPKIDLKVRDSMGREWQMSTIQFDFNMPARFGMTYTDKDGTDKQPYMVHRALLGSLERFFGVLIESYGGAFPVWLNPVQVAVIPVAEAFNDYGGAVARALREADIRVFFDDGNDRMNAKIRNAQNEKIPYMLVVGERDKAAGMVSLRLRTGEQKPSMTLPDFISFIKEKIEKKETI
jgi:threonyl-tRNA synthetase